MPVSQSAGPKLAPSPRASHHAQPALADAARAAGLAVAGTHLRRPARIDLLGRRHHDGTRSLAKAGQAGGGKAQGHLLRAGLRRSVRGGFPALSAVQDGQGVGAGAQHRVRHLRLQLQLHHAQRPGVSPRLDASRYQGRYGITDPAASARGCVWLADNPFAASGVLHRNL